jgi:hypothetical protein
VSKPPGKALANPDAEQAYQLRDDERRRCREEKERREEAERQRRQVKQDADDAAQQQREWDDQQAARPRCTDCGRFREPTWSELQDLTLPPEDYILPPDGLRCPVCPVCRVALETKRQGTRRAKARAKIRRWFDLDP